MPDDDRIEIVGVRAKGYHGVLEHERREGQDFVVDVVMSTDTSRAGRSDDLSDTVSYADVAAEVVALVEGEPLDLVETLAERIADAVLRHLRVSAVEVVVHKPQAPVGVPFGDVRVRVLRRRRSRVVISLGGNLGDPAGTIDAALAGLTDEVDLEGVSRRYLTAPVGGPTQPEYVNAVAVGTTALTPWGLLDTLHALESAHGRVREVRWGPRTLDLDLISYGTPGGPDEALLDDAELTLPHPRAHERGFVLVPWLDTEPGAVLRVGGELRPVVDLAAEVGSAGVRPAGVRPAGVRPVDGHPDEDAR